MRRRSKFNHGKGLERTFYFFLPNAFAVASAGIKESDWKLLRQLAPVALQRFCQRILEELDRVVSDNTKTPHQRYLDTFSLLQRRDHEIGQAFNDMRRSTALTRLTAICSHDLLTEEEFARFSSETRSVIELLLGRVQA